MPEKPNVMWSAKSGQYIRTQSIHLVVEIIESGLRFVLQTRPAPRPSQHTSRTIQSRRREALHYTEINTKN
jgi:hypothetical protein